MSKIKEAIEYAEKWKKDSAEYQPQYTGGWYKGYLAQAAFQTNIKKLLALLRAEEPCKTCGGSGKIIVETVDLDGRNLKKDCPDCQDKPEASEIYQCNKCTRFYKEEIVCPYCKDTIARSAKSKDIIKSQAAEIDQIEIQKIEAVAARVQAENDMCVLRGEHTAEIKKLTEALSKAKEMLEGE